MHRFFGGRNIDHKVYFVPFYICVLTQGCKSSINVLFCYSGSQNLFHAFRDHRKSGIEIGFIHASAGALVPLLNTSTGCILLRIIQSYAFRDVRNAPKLDKRSALEASGRSDIPLSTLSKRDTTDDTTHPDFFIGTGMTQNPKKETEKLLT